MANTDKMEKMIQHTESGSLIKPNSLAKDMGLVDFIQTICWYSYNSATAQKQFESSQYPSWATDKTLDKFFIPRIIKLMKVNPMNFIVKDNFSDVQDFIDGLTNFDIESHLAIRYGARDKKHAFIVQFLYSLRNSFAHGGFNIIYNEKTKQFTIVCLNRKDKGVGFSYRYLAKDDGNLNLNGSASALIDKLFKGTENSISMIKTNYSLNGYTFSETYKPDMMFNFRKTNNSKLLIILDGETVELVKKKINEDIVNDEFYLYANMENIQEITLYLSNITNQINKENICSLIKNKNMENTKISIFRSNDDLYEMFE